MIVVIASVRRELSPSPKGDMPFRYGGGAWVRRLCCSNGSDNAAMDLRGVNESVKRLSDRETAAPGATGEDSFDMSESRPEEHGRCFDEQETKKPANRKEMVKECA